MNDLTPFRPATPAMIVGRAFDDGLAPMNLSEPFRCSVATGSAQVASRSN